MKFISGFWMQVPPERPFDEVWTDYIDTFATLNMYRAELGLRPLPLPDDDPDPSLGEKSGDGLGVGADEEARGLRCLDTPKDSLAPPKAEA